MTRFAGLMFGIALIAAPALAQKAPAAGPTRNHVRLQILDQCVMSQSGKLVEEGAGPKCNCYAAKMSKALTSEEVATFRKALPKRLAADATTTLASCK